MSKVGAVLVTVGVVVAVVPVDWLTVVTDARWEREIIAFVGLVGAGFAAGWPWAVRHGGSLAVRSYLWVSVFVVSATIYVVSVSPLFLILAFSVLFTGMLDLWFGRAHVAAQSLRTRLDNTDQS